MTIIVALRANGKRPEGRIHLRELVGEIGTILTKAS